MTKIKDSVDFTSENGKLMLSIVGHVKDSHPYIWAGKEEDHYVDTFSKGVSLKILRSLAARLGYKLVRNE